MCYFTNSRPPTNIEFVINCISHPQFRAGQVDTGFIAQNIQQLLPNHSNTVKSSQSLLAAALYLVLTQYNTPQHHDPWYKYSDYRINRPHTKFRTVILQQQSNDIEQTNRSIQLDISATNKSEFIVKFNSSTIAVKAILSHLNPSEIILTSDNVQSRCTVVIVDSNVHVFHSANATHDIYSLPIHNYIKSEAASSMYTEGCLQIDVFIEFLMLICCICWCTII